DGSNRQQQKRSIALSSSLAGGTKCDYALLPLADGVPFAFYGEKWPVRFDASSGFLIVSELLDFETAERSLAQFRLIKGDNGSSSSSTQAFSIHIQLRLVGIDEFVPRFVRDAYEFKFRPPQPPVVAAAAAQATGNMLPATQNQLQQQPQCYALGELQAIDEDQGIEGRVQYAIKCAVPATRTSHFRLQSTNGRLSYCGPIHTDTNAAYVSLIVTASSGRFGSLS